MAGLLLAVVAVAVPSRAQLRVLPEAPGSLVVVSVEVDGQPASLYPAPDGSGRFYVEARKGARYGVTLANRTGERIGVVLTVDGLNAISGQRDDGTGRMYVLDPWERTTVRGWRASLQEVQQFTFVDERMSYAARSGKANGKMGWIEVAAYRERRPWVRWRLREAPPVAQARDEAEDATPPAGAAARADAAPSESKEAPAAAPPAGRTPANEYGPLGDSAARSYPGTGWGPRAQDPVTLVSFDPEPHPSQQVTLRYEYRSALVALGILPRVPPWPDRLSQRERGELGFAPPPLW
jgi:hypothetical protein